nr:insulinase family protein [Egibacter rhizosphaerae]
MSSRLFQEVRERRGLAYTVFSFVTSHADTGTWGVYAGTAADQVDEVWRVVVEEIERLREQGLGDDELARAKGALSGALVLALEDSGSRMSRLGKALVTGVPLLSLDETIAAVEAVTHDDVQALADELLGASGTAALVGPDEAVRHHDLEEVA